MDAGHWPVCDEAVSLGAATRSYWINYENIEGVLYLQWADLNKNIQLKDDSWCQHNICSARFLHVTKVSRRQWMVWNNSPIGWDYKEMSRSILGTVKPMEWTICYTKGFVLLSPTSCVSEAMDCNGILFMGPLPQTKQGNKNRLVTVYYFTLWDEVFAMPDQQAETLSTTFVREFVIVCHYAAPLEIHSGQGRNFESALFQEISRLFGICKTRSSLYHPNSNGL